MKRIIALFLSLILVLFSGCDVQKSETQPEQGGNLEDTIMSEAAATPVQADFSKTDEDMFTDRDGRTQYTDAGSIQIQLKGDTAAASDSSVQISGSTVTITEEGTYILSGSLDNGMVIVDAGDTAKLQIVLNGVKITSQTSAAMYILEADKVFVTLANGSDNTLANGGAFAAIDDNNIDGAVFSKQDLTFNGSGSLTVTSPAGHGIVCKDDLVFTGGAYTVYAASHGLDVNDSVRITGETSLTMDAGKDGIHCENTEDASLGFVYISDGTMRIEAEGDGVSAGSWLQVEKGSFDLLIGGGSEYGTKKTSDQFGGFMGGRPGPQPPGGNSTTTDESDTSMKGIKAASSILINGGTIAINSADDAVHADGSVMINGGEFAIASGDDAIHAEDTLTITAGTIHITESYEGLEALHIDVQGGEIQAVSTDDGLNAAGGMDSSGMTGGRDGMFGGRGGMGGKGGGMGASSDGSIVISGGNLFLKAAGDGLDANGTLTISGGYVVVTGPMQGDTATLDYDVSGVITGGTFIGTGASGMAQTFSDSGQGVVAVNVGSQSGGTEITLTDSAGALVLSYTPELSFAVVILSSPQMEKGERYTITIGTRSGTFEAS